MMNENSAPIPGENFTSDTKNYPWHQPPEFTDINKALDMLAKKLTVFKTVNGILTVIEMGVPLTRMADMIVTAGIGEGKWTPDFALLIGGPLVRMLELICKGFEVQYTIGIEEDEDDFITATFFNEQKKLSEGGGRFELLKSELPEIKDNAQNQSSEGAEGGSGGDPAGGSLQDAGFMAMQAPKEQASEEVVQ